MMRPQFATMRARRTPLSTLTAKKRSQLTSGVSSGFAECFNGVGSSAQGHPHDLRRLAPSSRRRPYRILVPRVIAKIDDAYVKVAKVQGQLAWHTHDDEDELFFILAGSLRIEMDERRVTLNAGDSFVVPKGTRHNPVAEQECLLMLIERKTTLHTGTVVTEKTRSVADQLRPV